MKKIKRGPFFIKHRVNCVINRTCGLHPYITW